jgi:hypothetical protein
MSQTILYKGRMRGSASAGNGAERTGAVRVRGIALPVEHGGWGLSLEPVLLGLLVAPSLAGLFMAVATLAAFLARHPLKLVIADRRRGRRFPRTPVAERFALLYTAIAFLNLLAAIKTASSYEFLLPLLLAAPFALIQLAYDRMGRSRNLLPELAGATAMASVASSIALAGGLPRGLAFGLWAILAARVVPTILYVRARLRILHGKEGASATVLAVHLLALLGVTLLAWARLATVLAVAALLILLARALLGFSEYDRAKSAKRIGIRELGFGVMTIIAVTLGHYFNL